MTNVPIGPPEKRPDTSAKLTKRARQNALRDAQVMPPHKVDLTLNPNTQEQMRAPFSVNARASRVVAKH